VNKDSLLVYQRWSSVMHFIVSGMTNHEIREVLIGVWSRLERDDQLDHIQELQAYYDNPPGTYLSPIAQAIKDGEKGRSTVNLVDVARIVTE
jgi:hypothetical protein